ncbi:DNA polymerase III subunit alpha [Buchnera aphidicola]|uniref:DNA polymerase III subunit alpha n=1 Tax=Buchnera aphidicola (Anoecia oenotherae) TaxID=1241833 RepID=A0A4D6Y4H1_9GAMM|nr:DNA polymerase III subunit alpha [Buchnera aphidicola]QCI19315.1 DNA polymerase III subunit alpha [Buchnera aphidicola (Anoecia oenotherae)]
MEEKFSHLSVHSDYSMVDGICKLEVLVKQAYDFKMPYLALTDYNNLFGILKFYKISQKYGIKPIIGLETKIISSDFGDTFFDIILLASNYTGYKNLLILISKAYNFKKNNKNISVVFIFRKWLTEFRKGLIIISSSENGDIFQSLLKNNYLIAKNYLEYYHKYFPRACYIEISRIGKENERNYLDLVADFSYQNRIPIVATNKVRFLKEEDFYAHTVRLSINQGISIYDKNFKNNYTRKQYFRSQDEMCFLFKDTPEVLVNSIEIAKRCNVLLQYKKKLLPVFYDNVISEDKFLIKKSKKGLEERLKFIFPNKEQRISMSKKYFNRLNNELKIINQIGFPGYFLVVMEFINWSKKNNIPVGPGRGSGAGSLVAYALKITELDPIKLNLLFERFLNPERVSMPDFDIDFCMDRRDEVINHVSKIYGKELVSQIITFGTMTAKSVVRDVGRAFGHPYGFMNSISKLIPLDPGICLDSALKISNELSDLCKTNSDARHIIFIAKKLEGLIKHVGKHAGGVIIAPKKIFNFSPLYCDAFGKNLITQFDKDDLEQIGLVKFDFLGLKTLTIIHNAVKVINEKRNILCKKCIDIKLISLKDKNVFNLLQQSDTIGIFQLESSGMKDLILRLKPDSFEDLIALIALFRPGPLQSGMVDNFINRKNGKERISYPIEKLEHDLLRPILQSTYGIILYQEQVMKIVQVLAGYTLGAADILRRVISKKKLLEMKQQRSIFLNGAKKNNISTTFAEKIFSLLENFADYGFNKSHSAAYALISYQTLWLKTYYPTYFMSSVMSSEIDNTERIITLVNEVKRMNIRIVPPSIKYSEYFFYVNDKNHIVYGMGAIKGVGKIAINSIVKIRKKYKQFSSFFDLCIKIDHKKITKKILEKLIMSGVLDTFNRCRIELLRQLNYVFRSSVKYLEYKMLKQKSLFGSLSTELKALNKSYIKNKPSFVLKKDIYMYEYETLGFYLTNHPVRRYFKEVKRYVKDISFTTSKNFFNKNKEISLFGVIISINKRIDRNNKMYITFVLDDYYGRIGIVIFSKFLKDNEKYIKNNHVIYVNGFVKFDLYVNKQTFIATSCKSIVDLREKNINFIKLIIYEKNISTLILDKLYNILKKYNTGIVPVYIYYFKDKSFTKLSLGKKWNVFPIDELFNDLKYILGKDNVKLKCKNIY